MQVVQNALDPHRVWDGLQNFGGFIRETGPWSFFINKRQSSSSPELGGSSDIADIGIGIVAVAVVAVGTKSILTMASWRWKLRDQESKGPAPGPRPLPFIGNVLELRSGYYETLYRYVDKPASVFWVLSTPFVVVNEEEGLRRVLGGAGGLYQKPKYFGYRSKAVSSAVQSERDHVASESIEYKPDGDTSRVALERMVADSLDTIKASMRHLLHTLEDESQKGLKTRKSDVVFFIRQAIVGLNLEILFGLSQTQPYGEDVGRIAEMIEFAGEEFARRMVNPIRVFFDWVGNVRFMRDVSGLIGLGRRLCKILDNTACKASRDADSTEAEQNDKLEAAPRSASGLSWVHAWVGKVGKIGKLGKVVGLLMASTQTVPLTAVWMLHLVGKDDAVRRDLKEELSQLGVHSLNDVTYEKLENMRLVDAVIKETLRLYPPFPLIQRQAQQDNVLGGICIPRGSIVYVVPWLVHRNKRYWSKPHDFQPQRFMENSSHGDAPSDWVYLPFGRGPRMCAGSKLAMAELKILLCNALICYKWESRCESEGNEKFPALGMIPKGVKMSFQRMDG